MRWSHGNEQKSAADLSALKREEAMTNRGALIVRYMVLRLENLHKETDNPLLPSRTKKLQRRLSE